MGRQTQVVMADEDEMEFIRFLRSTADIRLIESSAPSPQLLQAGHFLPRELGHWQYFIWNTAFPWAPQLGQVVPDAPQRAGWHYYSNIHAAPVIEYDRHNFEPRGVSGRVYWAKTFSSPNSLAYDMKAFSKWFDHVVRWVRKNGRQQTPGRHESYFLPAAWAKQANAR